MKISLALLSLTVLGLSALVHAAPTPAPRTPSFPSIYDREVMAEELVARVVTPSQSTGAPVQGSSAPPAQASLSTGELAQEMQKNSNSASAHSQKAVSSFQLKGTLEAKAKEQGDEHSTLWRQINEHAQYMKEHPLEVNIPETSAKITTTVEEAHAARILQADTEHRAKIAEINGMYHGLSANLHKGLALTAQAQYHRSTADQAEHQQLMADQAAQAQHQQMKADQAARRMAHGPAARRERQGTSNGKT